jgi:hypothetical protein
MQGIIKILTIILLLIIVVYPKKTINSLLITLLSISLPIYFEGLSIFPLFVLAICLKLFYFTAEPLNNFKLKGFSLIFGSLMIVYTVSMISPIFQPLDVQFPGYFPQVIYDFWGYLSFVTSIIYIYIIMKVVKTEKDLLRTIKYFAGGITVNVALYFLDYVNPGLLERLPGFLYAQKVTWSDMGLFVQRYGGTFRDYEILGEYAMLLVPITYGAFVVSNSKGYLIILFLSYFLLYITASIGSFIITAIMVAFLSFVPLFFIRKKYSTFPFFIAMFVLGASVAFTIHYIPVEYFIERIVFKRIFINAQEANLPGYFLFVPINRVDVWNLFTTWLPSIPSYGFGPISTINVLGFMSPHSLYLDYYFKFGFIGFVLHVILVAYTIYRSLKLMKIKNTFLWSSEKFYQDIFPFYFFAFICLLLDGFKIEFTRYTNSLFYFSYLIGIILLIMHVFSHQIDHKNKGLL